jgi:secretion/DNA translocation related TadE-like protein
VTAAAIGRSRLPAARGSDDGGSATVLVLALATATVTLAVGLAGLGAAVAARHRAEAAADLAALAGAQALQRGEPACDVVTRVALANGAVEVGCAVQGAEVVVRVGVDAGGLNLRARTTARAGPARAGPARAGPARAGPARAGPARAGPARAGPAQAGPVGMKRPKAASAR